jgi:hypothetical protein
MRTQILQSTKAQPGRRADAAHGWTYAVLGAVAFLPAAGILLFGGTAIAYADTDCGDGGPPGVYTGYPGAFAGPDTSCPFALNVVKQYNSVPGDSVGIDVYSPETQQTYTMNCISSGGNNAMVTCRGGDDAVVTFAFFPSRKPGL